MSSILFFLLCRLVIPDNSASITYKYDAENHLTNYNAGTATFVYDGDGNRVRKTVSGTTTYYLVDNRNPSGYAQVLEEFTSFGSTPTLFTYGLDLISQRQSNGTNSYYGYDGNGNTRFLTGNNAAIGLALVWRTECECMAIAVRQPW